MSETDKRDETRRIVLTDRAPVRIRHREWPVIAQARWHEGEIEWQASRRGSLRVRRRGTGPMIVYARYESQWAGERGYRGGELLDADDDVVCAIQRVGERAEEYAPCAWWWHLVEECIGDLPAQEL